MTATREPKPDLSAMLSLDRDSPRRSDADHLGRLISDPGARMIVLLGGKPVIRPSPDGQAAQLRRFSPNALRDAGVPLTDVFFLGLDPSTGSGVFALDMDADPADVANTSTERSAGALEQFFSPAVDLRSLAMQGVLSGDELAISATAVALANWTAGSRFCGRCGSAMVARDGGWRRKCVPCGRDQFPRTDPVVIMLVCDADRCVLGRQAHFPDGMMSALAGFLEPGEDIEAAVVRETAEEIGIAVERVSYAGSQPWPFPHSLMIGCLAQAAFQPLHVDTNELADARWFDRDEVRRMLDGSHPSGLWVPKPHAIAHWLVRRFAAG
ncbi:MAG: NAD(+) diphosphatase [Hyphomicrobiaceae bacterium]|nr:NAD(+) diphosphatase [Hyphomicrobiaceae bacterium]